VKDSYEASTNFRDYAVRTKPLARRPEQRSGGGASAALASRVTERRTHMWRKVHFIARQFTEFLDRKSAVP
jgi:hypothetical protein